MLAALPGCGSTVGSAVGVAGSLPSPSGSLRIALPGGPGSADPLTAATPSERLLVAQIYEPLTRRISGPYNDVRNVPGLALAARPARGHSVWRVTLRPGIRFQDGSRLDSAAVLANAARWRTTTAGRALLPGLIATDSPRPGLVRFFLSAPDPGFARRLASPQLGLVSQRALDPRSGEGAVLAHVTDSGTGPFELREHSTRESLIARNAAWWGTDLRLGPAIDSVTLTYTDSAAERARMLADGTVDVAESLSPAELAGLRDDPLIGTEGARGISREVHGIHGEGLPSFQAAWLATIGG